MLCARCGNQRMYEAWLRLSSPIRLFLTMAVPRYLSPQDTAESHPPIVAALRRRDAHAAIRHMEHGVLAVGEQIAAALGTPCEPAAASQGHGRLAHARDARCARWFPRSLPRWR